MTYPIDDVTPTSLAPSHHIKLADASGNKVLLNLVRAAGTDSKTRKTIYEPDTESLTRNTFPQQAIRMTNAGGEYADYQPPWQPYEQGTWAGGRGMRYFHKDKTRYSDAGNVLSHVDDQLTLSGLPRWTGGQLGGDAPHEDYALMPTTTSTLMAYLPLYGDAQFVARQFTPAYSMSTNRIILPITILGTPPGTLRVALYSDDGGAGALADPNASLANGTLTAAEFGIEEIIRQFVLDLNTPLTLTAGTLYWLVVESVTDGDATNNWQVWSEAGTAFTSRRSTDGTTWTTVSPYRVPCAVIADTTFADIQFKYFEYKRQLYALKIPQDGNLGVVFMHGWRGAADSNAGNLGQLVDATQTWTTNALAGGIVLITNGPGSEEAKPWRTIATNGGTTLSVDTPWLTTHTTATEYVVLGVNHWERNVTIFLAPATGVVVSGEWYYLCFGNDAVIYRMREYNLAGVWTLAAALEGNKAYGMTLVPDPTAPRQFLYAYNNAHALGPVYWRMAIPEAWGDLYRPLGEIAPTDVPWHAAIIANVTQSVAEFGTKVAVAGGFSTGLIASYDLETPLTIGGGNSAGVILKSDVTAGSGAVLLRLSNRTYAQQQKLLADYVFHTVLDRYRVATSVSEMVPSTGAHTGKPKLYDGLDDSTDTLPLTTTNDLVVMSDTPFTAVQANITVANTMTPLTLTAEYFNGEEFVSHTITGNFGGVANTPFGATGKQTISFNLPGDWQLYTANSVTGYALRIKCSGTLLATTALAEVAVYDVDGADVHAALDGRDGNDLTDEAFTFNAGDALSVGKSERFDRVNVTMGSVANSNAATLACYYFNGEKLVTATVSTDGTAMGGATLSMTGTITITMPTDWKPRTFNGVTAYFLHFQVSADLTDDILISEVSVYLDEQQYSITAALTANTWAWLTTALTPGSNLVEETVIRNVSLTLASDMGAMNIEMRGGVQLINSYPEVHTTGGQKITNLITYGQGEQLLQPYLLFASQRPHRIDTLNNDLAVPILVTAMETLADESNGRAACHSGVYLYFNMGPRLMRYFDGSLESVGPDLDEGLPFYRQGIISCIIPYAGDQVIYAVNAGARDSAFTSAVYLRAGSGVHELYRAPVGLPITDLRVQVVPGLKSDNLWINVGPHLVWVPLPSYTRDPLKDLDTDGDSNFAYLWDGYLDMGYLSDGAMGLQKVFVSVTIVSRNLSASTRWATVYYRLDDAIAWTKTSTDVSTSPVQEVTFATNYAAGKRLQLRLRLRANGGVSQETVIESVFVKGITIYPASYVYNIAALIGDYQPDKENRPQTHKASIDLAQLDTWRNAGTVLTMTDLLVPWNSRKVILNSLNAKVAALETVPHHEQYYITGQLMDITL